MPSLLVLGEEVAVSLNHRRLDPRPFAELPQLRRVKVAHPDASNLPRALKRLERPPAVPPRSLRFLTPAQVTPALGIVQQEQVQVLDAEVREG